MKSIGDVSVESILNGLFSNEADDEVPALDAEIVEELTAEEEEIVEAPFEEEEGADGEEMATEAARMLGDIGTMTLAMRTAEEFVWARSEEAAGSDNVFKKFWEWLKKICGQIKTFLITTWKRVQIWLAGDMKNISKWAADNKQKIEEAIASPKGKAVTLKVKLPVKGVSEASKIIQSAGTGSAIQKAISAISTGKGDAGLMTELKAQADKYNSKALNATFYGSKDVKASDVTLAKYSGTLGVGIYDILSNAAEIRKSMGVAQEVIKSTTNLIKAADTASKHTIDDKEVAKSVKDLAGAAQRAVNASSSSMYWVISFFITTVKTSKAYAVKAMAVGK